MTTGARVLSAAVRRAIVAHARRDAPRECCGFLIGRGGRAQFARPAVNVARRPAVRFRIDDREHIQLRRWLRQFAPPLEIVGVYHSHPKGTSRPSRADLAEANYPDWLFVVVGLRKSPKQIGVYRILDGRAARVVGYDAPFV